MASPPISTIFHLHNVMVTKSQWSHWKGSELRDARRAVKHQVMGLTTLRTRRRERLVTARVHHTQRDQEFCVYTHICSALIEGKSLLQSPHHLTDRCFLQMMEPVPVVHYLPCQAMPDALSPT